MAETKQDQEDVARFEGEGGATAPDKTPTKPATRPGASRADVAKAAAAAKKDSNPKADEEDRTGAGVPLVSDEERAKRDKRLQLAEDGSRLEQRPLTHPGLKSGQPDHSDYSVEEEIRQQWPGLFDDEDDE